MLLLLLVIVPMAAGCVRIKASLTVSEDDLVSGQIIAAAKPSEEDQEGPQLVDDNLPFAPKVAISEYDRDGYIGSYATFSNLTFGELPQLANMNPEAAGVDMSLRRAGDLVILEGRFDLSSLTDPEAEVSVTVAFPGEVTSTNGNRVASDVVEWQLEPGIVNTLSAQARYTDPSARSFTAASIVVGLSCLAVTGIVAALAWAGRDKSPRPGTPAEPSTAKA
ncbi:MAG: LppM family (lipo)protein [Mycobacterium sp.]